MAQAPDIRATDTEAAIEFRYNWLKFGPVVAFFLTLIGLGIYCFIFVPDLKVKLASIICIPGFSWVIWYLLSPLSLPGPLVRIGPEGVCDKRLSPRTVPWNAIERAYITVSSVKAYPEVVCLDLTDPDEWLSKSEGRASLVEQLMLSTPKRYAINPSGLTGTADDIVAAISRFRPQAVVSSPSRR